MSTQRTSPGPGLASKDPPPAYEPTAPETDAILSQAWDLACVPKPEDRILRLNKDGRPVWEHFGPYEPTMDGYRLQGFDVRRQHQPLSSSVEVTNSDYTWTCAPRTTTATLLFSPEPPGQNLTLRAFGKYLVVFVQSVEPRWGSPEPIIQDPKNALKVESDSENVFCITGTAIYNIQGDDQGFLVESQKWTRLWSWKDGQPQQLWRISRPGTGLTLTKDYILCIGGGKCTLYSRRKGVCKGSFERPTPNGFIGLAERYSTPVVSKGDLVFYKTDPETHQIFFIQNRKVFFQLWISPTKVEGPLVLRGSIDKVELKVLGETPDWKVQKEERTVRWPDPVLFGFDLLDRWFE